MKNYLSLISIMLLISSCSGRPSPDNYYLDKMPCKSMEESACYKIILWVDEYGKNPNNPMWTFFKVGQTDSSGEDVIFREFKGYCQEEGWTKNTCQSNLNSFFSELVTFMEAEFKKEKNEKMEKENSKSNKMKSLGY